MSLPPKLTKFTTARQSIISYDWVDDADGTGFVGYFLFGTEDNTAKDYHLGRNAVYSEDIEVLDGTDEDFDLTPFNNPRTIKGTAILSVPYNLWPDNQVASVYITCKIRKWDGSTETELASVISSTQSTTATVVKQGVWCIRIDIPETLFREGETLRLNIVPSVVGAGAGKSFRYGIDPKNRTGVTTNPITESKIFIPFKIDN